MIRSRKPTTEAAKEKMGATNKTYFSGPLSTKYISDANVIYHGMNIIYSNSKMNGWMGGLISQSSVIIHLRSDHKPIIFIRNLWVEMILIHHNFSNPPPPCAVYQLNRIVIMSDYRKSYSLTTVSLE